MGKNRIKTALALVGACAALSIVLPPLAGLLNAVGSVTLLGLAGYSAYRAWAWLESVVEASRRPSTVRRNLNQIEPHPEKQRARVRSNAVERAREGREGAPEGERQLRLPALPRTVKGGPSPARGR